MTMTRQGAALMLAAATLAACASGDDGGPAAVEIRGTDPADARSVATVTGTGSGGIVDYGDYRVAVAQEGETVESLARRTGLSPSELASYNGLQPGSTLVSGDELVVPEGAAVASADLPPVMALPSAPVESAPLGTPFPAADTAPPVPAETVVVASAEPVYDAAPAATPVPAPEQAPSGWSPDLAAAAIERAEPLAEEEPEEIPDEAPEDSLPPPPSATAPLPPAPAEPRVPVSPELNRFQTASLPTPFELTRPVAGEVAVPFNTGGSGGQRNEGVDFAAPSGAPVVAAEDGEVALVSESLGGLGTIVLVRHPNELMTVYGRLGDVRVNKGDYVERGQKLGVVADAPGGTEPRMHFEVRSGAESIDPMSML